MKSKAAKVIFLVSFIPWALVLLYGVYGAFFGVDFFGMCYGWEGFLFGIMIAGIVMCVVPILPVCLVYEICYILCNKVPRLRKVPTKKFFIIVLALCVITVGGVLAYVFRFEIKMAYQKLSAKHMVKKAEELIPYGNYTADSEGIFDIKECTCDTIMIDYDKPAVGLLYNASFDEFQRVELSKMNTETERYEVWQMKQKYYVQAVVPLSTPGKRLISFYYDEYMTGLQTTAFLVEMENGEIYYADRIGKKNSDYDCYLGLKNAKYFVDGGKYLSDLEDE